MNMCKAWAWARPHPDRAHLKSNRNAELQEPSRSIEPTRQPFSHASVFENPFGSVSWRCPKNGARYFLFRFCYLLVTGTVLRALPSMLALVVLYKFADTPPKITDTASGTTPKNSGHHPKNWWAPPPKLVGSVNGHISGRRSRAQQRAPVVGANRGGRRAKSHCTPPCALR